MGFKTAIFRAKSRSHLAQILQINIGSSLP